MKKKSEMTRVDTKIDGLRICVAATPLDDHFNAILDLDGPWTSSMLENHDDECPIGVYVWEGECVRKVWDQDSDDEYVEFEFAGTWRSLSDVEALRLVEERLPLTGRSIETRLTLPA